jgi:hypothetical protein
MPLPIKTDKETDNDFISRCAVKVADEFPNMEQRLAVCYSQLEKTKMSKEKKEDKFVLQPRRKEARGVYLKRCSANSKMKEMYPMMKKRMGYCLNAYSEYYRWWGKFEDTDIPVDSALGLCIAQNRASGLSYKEAYARCATKSVSPNTPIILSEDDDLLIEPVEFQECPPATLDIPLNLENRQKCIDQANYGPLDPNLPNEDYWKEKADRFNTKPDEAKKALCGNCVFFIKTKGMLDCIAQGLGDVGVDPYDSIKAGDLGYCEAYDFKCAASRTCDAWVVGGPITD